MNDSRSARLAVLIDADNASAKIADGLFEEIAKIGEASVRRIYGDFSTQRMKGWTDILSRHAIIPHQQFAYTTGKNASDITLVIDAMDLLHSGRFDGFCLVSSDSDFTRLASRIREQGVNVFGFGEQKTPESFRQACRRFIYTENLLPERIAPSKDSVGPAAAPLRQKSDALPMLTRVIDQMESEDGWVNLGTFGKQLQNLYTDFDPRTYGERKLSDLVRRTGAFELKHPEGGSLHIRLKQAGAASPAAKPVAAAPARKSQASILPTTPAAGVAKAPAARKAVPATSMTAKEPIEKPTAPGRARSAEVPAAPTPEAATLSGPVAAAMASVPALPAALEAEMAPPAAKPVRRHRPLGTPRG